MRDYLGGDKEVAYVVGKEDHYSVCLTACFL
jgi:hypothetical protein